jgi:5-methylthioribose kinase
VANREFFPKGGALHATKDMKIHHKRTSRYFRESNISVLHCDCHKASKFIMNTWVILGCV